MTSIFVLIIKLSIFKRNKFLVKKKNFSRTTRLAKNPHLKGVVTRLAIMTPKKPNSALRNVAKVKLYKNNRRLISRIPGIGYLPNKHNRVLVEGGRANDLPTVRYTLIRGVFDFAGLFDKKRRRSVYGNPRPENYTKHVRRCFRSIA